MRHHTTIAAIATAAGKGGIGIVRLSGSLSTSIASKITHRPTLQDRVAHFVDFYNSDNQIIDQGIVLFFKAPNSYTGEDVVELHGHGSPVILNMILKTTLYYGARLSEPGEFTQRAFLNSKLDLSQAEAVIDLINASSEMAAKCALRSLKGEFSNYMISLSDQLFSLIVDVEACIDFTEDEVPSLFKNNLQQSLQALKLSLDKVLKAGRTGQIIKNGIQVALIGAPNVGKSTLLNYLAQKNMAITTDIPGTTRDTISVDIEIQGVLFRINDTAGLRESEDILENIGIEKTLELLPEVDHILFVSDINQKEDLPTPMKQRIPQDIPLTYVYNKVDLSTIIYKNSQDTFYISSLNGIGIEDLKSHLLKTSAISQQETLFLARERHIEALQEAQQNLETAIQEVHKAQDVFFEIVAEKLHLVRNAIRSILGENADQDILGHIFSKFCIGK